MESDSNTVMADSSDIKAAAATADCMPTTFSDSAAYGGSRVVSDGCSFNSRTARSKPLKEVSDLSVKQVTRLRTTEEVKQVWHPSPALASCLTSTLQTVTRPPALLCGTEFTVKGNLQRHINNQHCDLTYECHLCGLEFKRKYMLRKHCERMHSNTSDITDISSYDTRKYSLPIQTTHEQPVPYSCEMCGCEGHY
jgi:hypothetical protein